MSKIDIDVMTQRGKKFYTTLKYEYNPLFKLDMAKIASYVLQRRPLLKYERDVMLFFEYSDAGQMTSVQLLLKKNEHVCDD